MLIKVVSCNTRPTETQNCKILVGGILSANRSNPTVYYQYTSDSRVEASGEAGSKVMSNNDLVIELRFSIVTNVRLMIRDGNREPAPNCPIHRNRMPPSLTILFINAGCYSDGCVTF